MATKRKSPCDVHAALEQLLDELGSPGLLTEQGEGSEVHPLGCRFPRRSVTPMDSHGLSLGLSYTYSKALGEGYERNGGIAPQDPRNRRADRQRYTFDVTHNIINYVYDLPFLNPFNGIAGVLLKGWQTNGVITL